MEKQISDTELVNSNVSSCTGSSTTCLIDFHGVDFHGANIDISLCILII